MIVIVALAFLSFPISAARSDHLSMSRDQVIPIIGPELGRAPKVIRQSHWEAVFESSVPWNCESPYERLKFKRALELLPEEPISRALEVGCAEGHFTEHLAERTDWLVAVDISTRAIETASARSGARGNIEFQQLDLVSDALPGKFNLIVCSEVLYYLADTEQLREVGTKLRDALLPGGCLLATHSFMLKDDMGRTGFDWYDDSFGAAVISRVFAELPGLVLDRSLVTELYRIDRFRRTEKHIDAREPAIEVVPLGPNPEPEAARFIVWGGAEARRSELQQLVTTEQLPVLVYRRVAQTGPSEAAPYRVSRASFISQMRLLRRRGYYSVTSRSVERHLRSRRSFAGRPVLISFDDGYMDFREIAWPILQACDFLAEIFIRTEMVGSQADWDAAYSPPTQLMGWSDILELRRAGVRFGALVVNRTPADDLRSRQRVATAATVSREALEARLAEPLFSIAMPNILLDPTLTHALASCGYKVGFTGRVGSAQLDDDPLNLPRIDVFGHWDEATFLTHLESESDAGAGGRA
jgi:SAM-dependent methyltransferase/peptidoglycan/xylan/chitin deacetylase (PgdA/CDA1 family)